MMRKFATIVAGALIAAATPGVASAATFFNYTINVGGDFGNPDPTVGSGRFRDSFSFNTTIERMATIEILSSMTTPTSWKENVNFVSNGVKLNATIVPATSINQFERRYLANFRIPAGAQNILVVGSAGPDGKYTGTLTLAGVPEPATWGLMILGFGMVGGALRRRSAKTSVRFA